MAEDVTIFLSNGEVREKTLRYQLKKSCTECPYTAKTQHWIGHHESAQEFHDIAKNDIPFPCHMSTGQSCVGNGVYMNRLCKLSHDPDKAKFQNELRESNRESVLFSWDGKALVDFHDK